MSRIRHNELEWHRDQKNAATLLSFHHVRHIAAAHRSAARTVQKRLDRRITILGNTLLALVLLMPFVVLAFATGAR